MSVSSVSKAFRGNGDYRISVDAAKLLMGQINLMFEDFLDKVKVALAGAKTVTPDALNVVYKQSEHYKVANDGPYRKSNVGRMLRMKDLRASPEMKNALLGIYNGLAKSVMNNLKKMLKLQKRKTLNVETVNTFASVN